jgi:hypothetical protein
LSPPEVVKVHPANRALPNGLPAQQDANTEVLNIWVAKRNARIVAIDIVE